MPTASLMIYVMGLEAAKTRPATEAERAEMRRLLNEGMDAGLCGFPIQRLGKHSAQPDFDGSPMVTDTMCDEDILNLARILRERDERFVEITQATGHIKEDLAFVEKPAGEAQRPILFQAITASTRNADIHRKSLNWLHNARAKGLPIFGQAGTVRSGFALTLEHWNLYDMTPEWRDMTTGTKEEKLAKMQDPAIREAVKSDRSMAALDKNAPGIGGRLVKLVVSWVENKPELEKYVGKSLGQIGQEEGRHPVDVIVDLSLATAFKGEFLQAEPQCNSAFSAAMLNASKD